MKTGLLDFIESYGFLSVLTTIFLVSGFYFQPNLGGRGLYLPFNIATWLVASIGIGLALLLTSYRKTIRLPDNFLFILSAPIFIIISGFFADASQPISWAFRQLFITGGVFFLFALFQFNTTEKSINQILLIIIFSASLHSIIGLFEIYYPSLISSFLPTDQQRTPTSIFQQINVQATYLVTGIALTLYLISRPFINTINPFITATLLAGTTTCSYIIIYSGSRVGLLSAASSILLLFIFRRHQLARGKAKKLTIAFLIALSFGAILGSQGTGLDNTIKKTKEIAGGTSSSARLSMYSIAWELIKQEPIKGHGIGSYLKVWNEGTGRFHIQNPGAKLPPYVTHPHNELAYWLIEGGIVSILGILLGVIAVIISFTKCGLQRGGSYAALLLPITLHTQVELPFYISATHWFLWLLLIFLSLRHQTKTYDIKVSNAASILMRSFAVLLVIFTSYFLAHSDRAQTDIFTYIKQIKTDQPYLKTALNNLYFKQYAEELSLRAYLYQSIKDQNRSGIKTYIEWANEEINVSPRLKLFEDLISAYTALNDEKKKCRIIMKGHYMYPINQSLKEINLNCIGRKTTI